MIEPTTQVSQTTPPVSGPAAPGGAAGGFAQVLAAFLGAGAGVASDTPADPAVADGRQSLADDGKTLPATLADDDDKDPDAALIWLPMPLPIPLPVARPIALPADGGMRAPIQSFDIAGQTLAIGLPSIAAGGLPGSATAPSAESATGVIASAGIASPASLPVSAPAVDQAQAPRTPVPQQGGTEEAIAAPVARSAAQVFAGAISAAAEQKRLGRDDERADSPTSSITAAIGQAETANRPVVQATAEAKHAPLDLRNDRGLQGMIDRIEVLRDDAKARDTRIRLVPDALGGVDIAVRKDGDAVHVHFTAETQATRTLLTDAQPRLAELADARGVKLGQTSVDAGTGGGASPHRRPDAPAANAPVPVTVPDADTSSDQRLA